MRGGDRGEGGQGERGEEGIRRRAGGEGMGGGMSDEGQGGDGMGGRGWCNRKGRGGGKRGGEGESVGRCKSHPRPKTLVTSVVSIVTRENFRTCGYECVCIRVSVTVRGAYVYAFLYCLSAIIHCSFSVWFCFFVF